jgi:hypothetical protein
MLQFRLQFSPWFVLDPTIVAGRIRVPRFFCEVLDGGAVSGSLSAHRSDQRIRVCSYIVQTESHVFYGISLLEFGSHIFTVSLFELPVA